MFKVTNIVYDIDEPDTLLLPPPTAMDVPVDDEDLIADYISDQTGWLIKSFCIEN